MSEGIHARVKELAARLGKHERTIWRWAREGCRLEDDEAVRRFAEAKEVRRTNVQKHRERIGRLAGNVSKHNGNGATELPPVGRQGAAGALARLEQSEERAYARLQAALESGERLEVEDRQTFWLRCAETLRKLDLAVELARRDEEEQVPKRTAEEVALFTAEWLRIAFMQFLSSEGPTLIGIKELGPWKAYAVERFKGILDLTVKQSQQSRSAIPDWASLKIKEAWHVS